MKPLRTSAATLLTLSLAGCESDSREHTSNDSSEADAAPALDAGEPQPTPDASPRVNVASTGDAGAVEGLLLSGPELESFARAPLARELRVTTKEPTTVEVVVQRDDRVDWRRHFDELATHHALPLLGFLPDETHSIQVTLHTSDASSALLPPLTLTTDPLPDDFPPMQVLTSTPERMEPGHTLFSVRSRTGQTNYMVVLNAAGEIVWYTDRGTNEQRQLPDGNILFIGPDGDIRIIDPYGELQQSWHGSWAENPADGSLLVDVPLFHHEVFPMLNGNFLSLSRSIREVEQYPTSYTDRDTTAPAEVLDDLVVEFTPATGDIIHLHSLHDTLDPSRIGYDSLSMMHGAFEWGHSNGVIHVPEDDTFIVSIRHQDALVKLSRTSAELIWILGPHGNWSAEFQPYLLTPVGSDFAWPYHAHAPQLTSAGTLLVFDNGNRQALPPEERIASEESDSRAVEYAIDAEAMTVAQLWTYGGDPGERLFSGFVSDANALPITGNALVTFGALLHIDGEPLDTSSDHSYGARIVEVTRDSDKTKVFELFIDDGIDGQGGWTVARAKRISSLYGD